MSSPIVHRCPLPPHHSDTQVRGQAQLSFRTTHLSGTFRLRRVATVILATWLSGAGSGVVAAAVAEPSVVISPAQPSRGLTLERMQRWHRDYRQRTRAVQLSTAALNQALDRNYPKLEHPCRQLRKALDSDRVAAIFPVPDRATDHHLRVVFAELRRAVRACRAKRPTELIYRLQLARGALVNMELTLRRYRLSP